MNFIGELPVVMPHWSDISYAYAFATISYFNNKVFDYRKENPHNFRNELEKKLPSANLHWLRTSHSSIIECVSKQEQINADGGIITQTGNAVAITTADCLPIVILNNKKHTIALIHAGWKGLANGIIENYFTEFGLSNPDMIRVWIAPSVHNDYEIGTEVKNALTQNKKIYESAFVDSWNGKYFVDLTEIVVQKFALYGISKNQIEIYPESVIKSNQFFSVRREGANTGRMAVCVGLL